MPGRTALSSPELYCQDRIGLYANRLLKMLPIAGLEKVWCRSGKNQVLTLYRVGSTRKGPGAGPSRAGQ